MFKTQNSTFKSYGKFKVLSGGGPTPEDLAQDEILYQIWLSQNVGLHQYFATCGCGNHLKWAYNKTSYPNQTQAQAAADNAANVFNTWLTENVDVDEYTEEGEFYGTWAYGSTIYPSESAARTASSNAAFQVWLTNNVNIHQYTVAGPNYGKWAFYSVSYDTQAEAEAAEQDSYNEYQSWLTNNHGINQYFGGAGGGSHNGQWALDNTEYPSEASAVTADAANGDAIYLTWKTTNVGVHRYNRGGSHYGQWVYGSTEYPSQQAAEAAEEADYQAWLTTTTDIDEVQYTGSGPHSGQWVFFKVPYASQALAVTAKRARHNALFQIWLADNFDINQYFGPGECNGWYGFEGVGYSTLLQAQSSKAIFNSTHTLEAWLSANVGVNKYNQYNPIYTNKWAFNNTLYNNKETALYNAAGTWANSNVGVNQYLGQNHGETTYMDAVQYGKWAIDNVGFFDTEQQAIDFGLGPDFGFQQWLNTNVGVGVYFDDYLSSNRYAYNNTEYYSYEDAVFAQFLSTNIGLNRCVDLPIMPGGEDRAWAFNQHGPLTYEEALALSLQTPYSGGPEAEGSVILINHNTLRADLNDSQELKDSFDLGTNDFCIETWFNVNSLNGYYDPIIFIGNGFNGAGPMYSSIYLSIDSANRIAFRRYDGSTNFSRFSNTINIPLSTWMHVAVSREGDIISFFVNGVPSGSASCDGISFDVTEQTMLRIGGTMSTGMGDFYLDGKLAGLRIVNGSYVYSKGTFGFTPPNYPAQPYYSHDQYNIVSTPFLLHYSYGNNFMWTDSFGNSKMYKLSS